MSLDHHSPDSPLDFQLISAIRFDPALRDASWNSSVNADQPSPFMLLPYHFDRLNAAAADHGWQTISASLSWASFQQQCQRAVEAYNGPGSGGPLKLRPLLRRDGSFTIEVTPAAPLTADPMLAAQISPLMDSLPDTLGEPVSLFLDKVATPSSPFTATKTTRRDHYAAARARLGIPAVGGTADVLLWNSDGMLTETSVRNFALFRRGRWVTPHDSTGCLRGVARRWLLEQGLIVVDNQALLRKDVVREGELALVFNAVEGCRPAVMHLRKA
ncbi:aminotransferase [Gloeopeniophorella convolvens]|nr:aminotransferase [Gloeopeniophorella convolvens]